MQTRSMGPMSWSTSCMTWSGFSRSARMPPWILGCRVFTRPSSISGAPVTSSTWTTGTRDSSSAFAVPPVEMISNPIPESLRAKAATPRLSETETSARRFIQPPFPRKSPRPPGRAAGARPGATAPAGSPWSPPASPAPTPPPPAPPALARVHLPQQALLGLPRPHRHRLLGDDGPRVHLLDHEVHRHPRLFHTGLERPLDGAQPAKAGQQRRVDVEHGGEPLQEGRREHTEVHCAHDEREPAGSQR